MGNLCYHISNSRIPTKIHKDGLLMRKCFKKFVLLLLLAIFSANVAMPQTTYAAQQVLHDDANIPSVWAGPEIDKAKMLNLLTEKIQGKYRESVTREELSELTVKLYEALSGKKAVVPDKNPFADTNNKEVIAANGLGIVNGRGSGKFAPDETATREEVSVMLYRTLKASKPEYDLALRNDYTFSDQDRISPWAKEAVEYLYGTGVIDGVGGNRFDPKRSTSREEAIVLSKRVYMLFSESQAREIEARSTLAASRGGSRSPRIEKLRELIPQEMGKPYKWAAAGPDSYDCSGLVYSLFKRIGIPLPRVSSDQATVGTYVAKEDLAYGDLVFFARNGKSINHVGIYVGNGEFVHAPQTGDVVKTTTLMSGYYANTYYTARRVIQ